MTMKPAFPNEAPFELSAYYPASRIRFAHIPAGVREAGFHTPPDRLLAIWLDGHVEFETSDGEVRRLPPGKAPVRLRSVISMIQVIVLCVKTISLPRLPIWLG